MSDIEGHVMGLKTTLTLDLQAGFTLIEVLSAIAVFTIGILAVMTMQATSITGNARARQISEETTWASDQIEQLIGASFVTVANGGPITSSDGNSRISWTVIDGQPASRLKTIQVTITPINTSTNPVVINLIKAQDMQ